MLVSGFISMDAKANIHMEEKEFILSYLKETNAEIEEVLLSGWSILNRSFMDKESMSSKLDQLIEALDLNRENPTRESRSL